jgi:hypothetical protein
VNARRTETDWAGVALGLAVASLAAFQMLKLAPALPVMIADYGYSRVLAGAMMSVYAVAALLLSLAAGGLLARRPGASATAPPLPSPTTACWWSPRAASRASATPCSASPGR